MKLKSEGEGTWSHYWQKIYTSIINYIHNMQLSFLYSSVGHWEYNGEETSVRNVVWCLSLQFSRIRTSSFLTWIFQGTFYLLYLLFSWFSWFSWFVFFVGFYWLFIKFDDWRSYQNYATNILHITLNQSLTSIKSTFLYRYPNICHFSKFITTIVLLFT